MSSPDLIALPCLCNTEWRRVDGGLSCFVRALVGLHCGMVAPAVMLGRTVKSMAAGTRYVILLDASRPALGSFGQEHIQFLP